MLRIIKITTNKATGRAFPEQYFLSITAECFCSERNHQHRERKQDAPLLCHVHAAATGVTHTCPGPRRSPPSSTGEILEDVSCLHPVLEAGQPPLPDLLPPFVSDDVPARFHDHKPGDGHDVVPGPQLTVGEKRATEGQRGTGQAAARLQGPASPQRQLSLQSLRTQPARWALPLGWGFLWALFFLLLAGSKTALSQRNVSSDGTVLHLRCPMSQPQPHVTTEHLESGWWAWGTEFWVLFNFIYLFICVLAALSGLWDLSSLTRDWTPGHGSESTES